MLGATFPNFVEINFDFSPETKAIFEKDLDPERIIRDLSIITGKEIVPNKTLLFLDEIQECPRALASLRYFYELMPFQHVIAAGSLLDFTIEKIGIPVGRVSSLYMFPMTFIEFLHATENQLIVNEILNHDISTPINESVHTKILTLLAEYLAIGGMPEAVKRWVETKNPQECFQIHNTLVDTYRQDFPKYANKFQIEYVDLLFTQVPKQIGQRFKYSAIDGDFRKRELAPALEQLGLAGIIHKVTHTSGNSLPVGAEADPTKFKLIFIDVALTQTILGLNQNSWFLHPMEELINKGELIEAFVGQELLAYSNPQSRCDLYYWQRETHGSQAEVDYLSQKDEQIIPIEVKSGSGKTLKSMHLFLQSHPKSQYGVRFSSQNYSVYENIHSYPLYAVGACFQQSNAVNQKF